MEQNTAPLARRDPGLSRARIPGLTTLNQKQTRDEGTLVLAHRELELLPPQLSNSFQWCNLHSVSLNANLLRKIPPELQNCKQLKHLDLSDNLIDTLADALHGLEVLVRLNLARNRLQQLDIGVLKGLKALRTLILSENWVSDIPNQIGELGGLRVLHIDRNPFTKVPCSLACLTDLKELKLDWPSYFSPPASGSLVCTEVLAKLTAVDTTPLSGAGAIKTTLTLQDFNRVLLGFDGVQEVNFTEFWERWHRDSLSEAGCEFVDMFVKAQHGDSHPPAHTLSKVLDKAIRCRHSGVAISIAQTLLASEQTPVPWYQVYEPIETSLNTGQPNLAFGLLQAGVRPKIVSATGRNAIHLAADQLAIDVVLLLKSLGDDVKAVDENRNTLLHLVLNRRHEKERHKLSQVLSEMAPDQVVGDLYQVPEILCQELFAQKSLSRADTTRALVSIHQNTDLASWLEQSPPNRIHGEFLDKIVTICETLVEQGVEPNSYNSIGLCAWHIPIIMGEMELFSRLRESPKLARIDWNLGAFGGDQTILHLSAWQKEWRIFLELLEGRMRNTAIQLDSRLKLPDSILRHLGAVTITSKIYLKYLKNDFRVFLKTLATVVTQEGRGTERKVLLSQRSRVSLSAKSRSRASNHSHDATEVSQESVRIGGKLYVPKLAMRPYPPKSFGMSSFNSMETERDRTQASKVYAFAPKQSLMGSRGDFSPSFLRDLKDKTTRQSPLQLSKTHTKTLSGGNQITWLQSKLSNMAIQGALSKPHLLRQPFRQDKHQISTQVGAKNAGQTVYSVVSTPVKKLDLGASNRVRDGSSFTLPQADLMVGRNITLSQAALKGSRIFNQELLQKTAQNKKKVLSTEETFKVYVKMQLKDTINFRYSCKWLGNLSVPPRPQETAQLVDQLMAVLRYLRKAAILIKHLFQMLEDPSKCELLCKIKRELDHDSCLDMLCSFLRQAATQRAYLAVENRIAEDLTKSSLQVFTALFGSIETEAYGVTNSKRRVLCSDSISRGGPAVGGLVRPQNYQKLDVEDSDSLEPGDGPAKVTPILPEKTSRSQVAEEEPSIDSSRQLSRQLKRSNRFFETSNSLRLDKMLSQHQTKLSAGFGNKIFTEAANKGIALPSGTGTSILRRLAKPALWPVNFALSNSRNGGGS